MGYKTETSCHAGIIKLQYHEFLLGDNGKISLGEDLIRLMKQVEGKELDIYWLDDNQGNVLKALIYLRNEKRYICEARPKPTYNRAIIEQTEEDRNARKIMSSYVATIEGIQRKQTASLEKVTVLNNRPTTLTNNFQIDGLKRRPTEANAKDKEPKILQPIEKEEYDLIPEQTTFKKDLKDRF